MVSDSAPISIYWMVNSKSLKNVREMVQLSQTTISLRDVKIHFRDICYYVK